MTRLVDGNEPLKLYRSAFLLPLTLDYSLLSNESVEAERPSEVIDQLINLMSKTEDEWEHVTDPLGRYDAKTQSPEEHEKEQQRGFAEAVYVHDFVREFLYEKTNLSKLSDARHLVLFRNKTEKSLIIKCSQPSNNPYKVDAELELRICDQSIYFFRVGMAFLRVELEAGDLAQRTLSAYQPEGFKRDLPITLAEAMAVNTQFRRLFPPYYYSRYTDPEAATGGEIPNAVSIFDENLKSPVSSFRNFSADVTNLAKSFQASREGKDAKPLDLLPHWRFLLPGMICSNANSGKTTEKCWFDKGAIKVPSDDRLPFQSSICLEGIRNIDANNWAHLTFADHYNDTPACKEFYNDKPASAHSYDRYFDGAAKGATKLNKEEDDRTRFLITAYSFVSVGDWNPYAKDPSSPGFFTEHVGVHMRRHYAGFALVLYLQFYMLLSFSSWISSVVKSDEHDYKDHLTRILGWYYDFRHSVWTSGVSSQLQARELFDKWRNLMALDDLHVDLADEVRSSRDYLAQRADEEENFALNQFNELLGLLAIIGLPIALLSMGPAIGDFFEDEVSPLWAKFGLVLLTLGLSTSLGGWYAERLLKKRRRPFKILNLNPGMNIWRWVSVIGAGMLIFGAILSALFLGSFITK